MFGSGGAFRNGPSASLPFFFRSLASRRYIKRRHQFPVDAIAVRLNRVIEIAGSGVWRAYHPYVPPGDSANNMVKCLMSRSITPPCPVFELRTARRRRVRMHALLSCDDIRTWRDVTRHGMERKGKQDFVGNRRFLVFCTHPARLTLSTSARAALSRAAHQSRAHSIIPLRANDLSVRIPYGPLLRFCAVTKRLCTSTFGWRGWGWARGWFRLQRIRTLRKSIQLNQLNPRLDMGEQILSVEPLMRQRNSVNLSSQLRNLFTNIQKQGFSWFDRTWEFSAYLNGRTRAYIAMKHYISWRVTRWWKDIVFSHNICRYIPRGIVY